MPAIAVEPFADAPFEKAAIYNEELVLIAAAGHPPIRSARDARSQTILVFEHGCPWRKRLEQWFALTGDTPERMIEITSYHAMLGCVVVGMGISLVPRMVLETFPEMHRLSVHPLPPELRHAQMAILWRKGARSPKLDALVELVTSHAATINARRRGAQRGASAQAGRGGGAARAALAPAARTIAIAPMAHYDAVVCGLGVMGSAALYHLARRGQRVLGLDRFAAGHDRGSSHGETRVIRLAYFEHPSYVPLVRRAYELWRELENEAARPLLHVTGIAEIGPPDGALVTGTLEAARLHDIPHELIAAPELMRRYPAFRLPPHYVGVVQPDGGFLEAEAVRASDAGAGAKTRRRDSFRRNACARSSRRTTRRAS